MNQIGLSTTEIEHDVPTPDAPTEYIDAADLRCTEIWGGNQRRNAVVALPGMRGWLRARPHDHGRGGDVHYLSVCSSGMLSRLCVADVAGHGEPVSEIAHDLYRLIRKHLNRIDQSALLARLNNEMTTAEMETHATAVVVTYLAHIKRLSISYAGHPPAWYYRAADARWIRVEMEAVASDAAPMNLPLAVEADTLFTRKTFNIESGDRLFLFSDGLTEAATPEKRLFGTNQLAAFLHDFGGGDPRMFLDQLDARVAEWTGGNSDDDVTMLLVEFDGRDFKAPLLQAVRNRIAQPFRPRPKPPTIETRVTTSPSQDDEPGD